MILTCPQCQTRYQADASKFLPSGRKVRCAKCGHVWHQDAPAAQSVSAVEAAQSAEQTQTSVPPTSPGLSETQRSIDSPIAESAPVSAAAAVVTPKTSKASSPAPQQIGMIAGWLGLVAVIVLIGWSTLNYRQQIATVWPQAGSLYSALGLHVNTRGLDFADVAYHRETEDGQQVLAISGKLVNISASEVSVPPIEVTLTDSSKRTLYHWNFNSGIPKLRPGQTAAFLTRLASPPSAARHLELRFASAGG